MPKRYHDLVQDSARFEGFEFRDDDIIISTPPKCGTTWTQRLVSLLLFDSTDLPTRMSHVSPWLEMNTRKLDDVLAELNAQTHRRFIKSHTPFDGLPDDKRVTYISVGRDLRDVAISWGHHFANTDMDALFAMRGEAVGFDDLIGAEPPELPPDDPHGALMFWITHGDETSTIGDMPSTLHHIRTFWDRRDDPNVVVLHYSDIQRDVVGQMAYLAERLGLERSHERLAELAPAASFEEMKSKASVVAPNSDQGLWKSTESFFHSGTSGQWRDMMTDEDVAIYDKRLAELASPDFVDWLHNGSLS
ncbi:MAG: aryl sulfotransferase [Actinomycetota bacterium]|jgi:hypothetical protein